jgi:hypothetical protein
MYLSTFWFSFKNYTHNTNSATEYLIPTSSFLTSTLTPVLIQSENILNVEVDF